MEGAQPNPSNLKMSLIVPWKVEETVTITAVSSTTLSEIASKLDAMKKVSKVFAEQPNEENLHIVVQLPGENSVIPHVQF